jgi:hypothetical protein
MSANQETAPVVFSAVPSGTIRTRLSDAGQRATRRALLIARRKKRTYLRIANRHVPLQAVQDWLTFSTRRDEAFKTLIAFGVALYGIAIASGTALYMLTRAA